MKKSIIVNLVFYSFLTIGILFVGMIFYFTSYLESFAIVQKSKVLMNNIEDIQDSTYYAFTHRNDMMDIMYQNIIDTVSSSTESSVTVFDNNGIILAQSGKNENADEFDSVTERVTKPVLKGENLVSVNIFKDQYGNKILTVGAPLKNGNEIFGGVMFNQLIPEVKSVYGFVTNRMFFAVIIAMILSVCLFGFLSIKITSPIGKMNIAVKEFTKGNFKKRVEYSSDNELGELAHNINEMAYSLENLENLRKGFVSDVSHELRTPLTTISGFVEGIIDGTIPEENHREYLDVVLSESKRLSRLITSLLQVTRMENGEFKMERTNFDINELMRQTLIKFEMMITAKDLDVSLNIDDGKLMVNADRDSITQVLVNLINNAVKFTPAGGRIGIDITPKKDKVHISIENTGHGIEPGDLKNIWDRFYKADKSRGAERSGTGLGLYIVKRIINMHGEEITVNSRVDEITVFTFTLPGLGQEKEL